MADSDGNEAMVGQGQRENYATAANLRKRQALFDFIDPRRSRGRPAVSRIGWSGEEVVLDAGCGNGTWARTLIEKFSIRDIIGMDLSVGMLRDARTLLGSDVALAAGDVARLPFFDETFDVVLCLWMLYHVPDQEAALREFRRVLRPGGQLLVTTNRAAGGSLGEVTTAAVSEILGRPVGDWLPQLNFASHNGAEVVGKVFSDVEAEQVVTGFALPTPEPVIELLRSSRGPIELQLGELIDWAAVEEHVSRAITQVIADEGLFRTEMASISFLAHK